MFVTFKCENNSYYCESYKCYGNYNFTKQPFSDNTKIKNIKRL